MPKIKLSSDVFEYLMKSNFLSDKLHKSLEAGANPSHGNVIIDITPEDAESVRDAASVQLQKVGFGPDYEPNADGKVLETVIDALYIP